MSILSRSVPKFNFNYRNLLSVALIALVIIFLFFIPEIIKSLSYYAVSKAIDERGFFSRMFSSEQVTREVVSYATSPLEDLIENIEREESVARSAPNVDTRASLGNSAPTNTAAGQKANPNLYDKSNLTWDAIKSDQSQEALYKAQAVAQGMAGAINAKFRNTKNALFNFIGGVDYIFAGADRVMNAKQALDYIERLDVDVARAMISENVDRADYMRWMEVSVSPAIDKSRSQRLKEEFQRPFDPEVRLSKVLITYLPPPNASEADQNKYSRMQLAGTMKGSDVKKLTVLRDGRFVTEVPFTRIDRDGMREFSFAASGAFGNITFVAEDKQGFKYERTYTFFPKIMAYPKAYDGIYTLPYDWELNDKRIDRLFYTRQKLGSDSSFEKSFVTF